MSSTSSERYRTVSALHVTLRRVIWDHVDKPDDMRLARIGLNAPRDLTQSRWHIRQVTIYWPFIFSPNTIYHYQRANSAASVLLRLWFTSSFKFFDHGRIGFQGPWHRRHRRDLGTWKGFLTRWSCSQGSRSQASRFQRIQSIRYLSFAHPCRSPYPSRYMLGYSWVASTWTCEWRACRAFNSI